MFKIKRADGYPFETIAYDVKEENDFKEPYRLKFLIFDKGEWAWVYAKDFIPA